MTTVVNVVFLDFDGVLNSHKSMKFFYDQGVCPDDRLDGKAIKLLNKITDTAGAKIVVSSTWRLPFLDADNLDGLIVLMRKHGITGDIIGMTPDLWNSKHDRVRGDEIQSWIDNCGLTINKFVIIDDDSDMAHLRKFLVKTSMRHGLCLGHALDAIQMLGDK